MTTPLLLDWDGTVTEVDSLHMVVTEFGDPEVFRAFEYDLGRRLSLHEVITHELATVTAPLDVVVDWLVERVRLRAGFAELVAATNPVIVSAGFHELIEPILAREGIDLEIRANRVRACPSGWVCAFAGTAICSVCGEPCKRQRAEDLSAFDYVGDGFSDRCIAAAARHVFARAGLARYLAERGRQFTPFTDFHEVLETLAAGTAT